MSEEGVLKNKLIYINKSLTLTVSVVSSSDHCQRKHKFRDGPISALSVYGVGLFKKKKNTPKPTVSYLNIIFFRITSVVVRLGNIIADNGHKGSWR